MTQFIIIVALLAAAVFVAKRFIGSKQQPPTPTVPQATMMKRPRFKDFRHSGSTYEESHANYVAALEEYQRLTGITYNDDEE